MTFKEKLDNDLKNTLKKIRTHLKGEQGEQGPQGIQGEKERPDHKVLKGTIPL